MALTDLKIRTAKPAVKRLDDGSEKIVTKKLSDGAGLQLWVESDGGKRWRLAYRFDSKQKTMALGVYPSVGLKEARELALQAKRLLRDGIDPGAAKKRAKVAAQMAGENTFEAVAKELIAKKEREGRVPATLATMQAMVKLARPYFGARPIAEIDPQEILIALQAIEKRERYVTAAKLRAFAGGVFRYAIATRRANSDPTSALRGALTTVKTTHRPAITESKKFGGLLRAVDCYDGAPETRIALQLLALVFVRPGELRRARWHEFDFEDAVWTIPAERMKMRREHRVPLSLQAIAILRDLRSINNGDDDAFLFPNQRQRGDCMSNNALMGALHRLGYGEAHSAHGFRSAASSMLNESKLWHGDAIERQLAHEDKNDTRKAYARADFWEERVKMMAWWADECDRMRAVTPTSKAA